MGFGRDLGAALTFGLSATTKQKEAERQHAYVKGNTSGLYPAMRRLRNAAGQP